MDGFVEQVARDAFLFFVELEAAEEVECFVEREEAELGEGEFLYDGLPSPSRSLTLFLSTDLEARRT